MQGERHALFAGANGFAAVDIKQLHIGQLLAGALHFGNDGAAGGFLVSNQSQVTGHGIELRQRMITQTGRQLCHQRLVIDLAQEDLLVGAAVTRQIQTGLHIVGQLAKAAHTHAVAQDVSGNAGVQVRHILGTLHLKGYAEGSSQVFQCALNGKEVLMLTKGHKAQVQALFRQFGQRKLFGHINVGKLKQTAGSVALFQIGNRHVQQAGCQQGAHDGQVGGDGVDNSDDIALRCIGGNVQGI